MRAWFDRFARKATEWAGSYTAFALAILLILGWVVTGPIFQFSDTWQLVINTGTTIITFLMVFVIQQAQNREMLAVHVKLNEIIASLHGASNRVLSVERLSESELSELYASFARLAEKAQKDRNPGACHTIEEAVGIKSKNGNKTCS